MTRALPLVSILIVLLVGCLESGRSSGDDDDDATDDDDVTDDDDDATDDDDAGDDDDVVGDDDDAVDDDDAGDDDDVTPAPTTHLTFLAPASGDTIDYVTTFAVGVDGDEPGLVHWSLDGAALGTSSVFSSIDQALFELDTVEYPDGEHTMVAELPDWGFSDELTVDFGNGDLLVYDYGAVTFDPDGWGHVYVNVPGSGVSLQVQAWADPADDYEYLAGVLGNPSGDWIIGFEDSDYTIYAAAAEPWAGCVPNHPEVAWQTGQYDFWPWSDEDSVGLQITPQGLVKRWFDTPEAGLLAIDFYFVPGSGLNATSAPTSANFVAFVDALEAVYLEVGIGLGDLRYFDAPSGMGLASITTYDELVELFRQGVPSDDRVLDVFFVDELDLPQGDPIGIAAHIPGPALASGTGQSGVAMITGPILDGDEWTAAALAGHEIGHYLGLYHPSEIGGGSHDPLTDTANCCDSSDCWETNLMDPYLYGNTELSDDQGWVVLRHPLVQLVDPSELPARSWSAAAETGWSIPAGGVPSFCGTGR